MQSNTGFIIAIIIGIITMVGLILITLTMAGHFRKKSVRINPPLVPAPSSCPCALKPPTDSDEFMESFPLYAFEIIADMVLAILLGLSVNGVSNFIERNLGLPKYGKISVQMALIIIVLYIMKIDSKYLYPSWKGQTGYGIIFTAIFLAVQKNITSFVENI